MNKLILGSSTNVHIPNALHLERHTTTGAKQTHGVIATIMRRVSMQWTDNEAQKKVLEQKGKLLNALNELEKTNNDSTVKPQQTIKQLEKIQKLVAEIETWEKKTPTQVDLKHHQNKSMITKDIKALKKALTNDRTDSITYKAGEELTAEIKAILGSNIHLSSKEKKTLTELSKTTFFDVQKLENAFDTVEKILTQHPETKINQNNNTLLKKNTMQEIRAKYENEMPENLQAIIKKVHPLKQKGQSIPPSLAEDLEIAYKILNRHDLNNEQKDKLFRVASIINNLKYIEGKDVKGYKTNLYRALSNPNKTKVDQFLEKVKNGDIYKNEADFEKDLKNMRTISQTIQINNIGAALRTMIAPHLKLDNQFINAADKKTFRKIQETLFTDVKQLKEAIETVRTILRKADNEEHRGESEFSKERVDGVNDLFNRKLSTQVNKRALDQIETNFAELLGSNIHDYTKVFGTSSVPQHKETTKFAQAIANRQDLVKEEKQALFLAVKMAVDLKYTKTISDNGQIITLYDALSPSDKKKIDNVFSRVLEGHAYVPLSKLNDDINAINQVVNNQSNKPLGIALYIKEQVSSAEGNNTIEKPIADLLKLAQKIAKRTDLTADEKDRLFAHVRMVQEMKSTPSIDPNGKPTTLYNLLTSVDKKKMEKFLKNVEDNREYPSTEGEESLLLQLTTAKLVLANAKQTHNDNYIQNNRPIPDLKHVDDRLNVLSPQSGKDLEVIEPEAMAGKAYDRENWITFTSTALPWKEESR